MRVLAVLGFLVAAACNAERRQLSNASTQADSAIYAVLLDSLRPMSRPVRLMSQYADLPNRDVDNARSASWPAA
jgi:hypothetical protein